MEPDSSGGGEVFSKAACVLDILETAECENHGGIPFPIECPTLNWSR